MDDDYCEMCEVEPVHNGEAYCEGCKRAYVEEILYRDRVEQQEMDRWLP